VGAVLQDCGEILIGALGKIFSNDHDGDTGRAEILLRAGKNHSVLINIDRARGDVRGHIGDEWNATCFRRGAPLRPLDGVIRADMHVGSIR